MAHEFVAAAEQRKRLCELLSEQDRNECDDATLDRMLRADKGNVKTVRSVITDPISHGWSAQQSTWRTSAHTH